MRKMHQISGLEGFALEFEGTMLLFSFPQMFADFSADSPRYF
jgi:hypothetical protein